MRFSQFVSSALALVLSYHVSVTNAANCSPPNQVFWDSTAVDMMWSMRSYLCSNVWWENIKVVPAGNWCGGFCYNGWWYVHNHPSQQACWVSLLISSNFFIADRL